MSKLTKEQLKGMSDFEVNKALCTLLGKDVSGICELRNQMTDAVNDYCNTHNDIMPLAFEHGVGFAPNKESWEAFTLEDNYQVIQNQFVDDSPLRAIACCLILVLQEGK